jgi:anaerobic ribonucleoside-triphosphate reductase activating protein
MNILYVDYTLKYKSIDIYVAGCSGSPHCTSCHNPESWNFNNGRKYSENYFTRVKSQVKEFSNLIENIMIFGGEPLDQNHDELLHMLLDLKSLNKKIWLFTRYEIENIPKEIISMCDYIKTGEYLSELQTEDNIQYGIKLATSNQKIIKIGG